jgi:hypothetical protein
VGDDLMQMWLQLDGPREGRLCEERGPSISCGQLRFGKDALQWTVTQRQPARLELACSVQLPDTQIVASGTLDEVP